MVERFFPYRQQLTILQLEWYQIGRFWRWVSQHFWQRKLEGKKQLIFNAKAKLVLGMALLEALVVLFVLTHYYALWGLLLAILLATQAYLYLGVAALLIKPLESVLFIRRKTRAEKRLRAMPHLKVVGIGGSFAKTSTKIFLYEMLRGTYETLKTPGNYNVPMGLAKVIEWELYPEYDFFIYEGGAFWPGDIRELATMLDPDFAIITGLNEQHLERFGSLEKAISTELELAAYAAEKKIPLFANGDDPLIRQHLPKYSQEVIWYGVTAEEYTVQDLRLTDQGSIFTLVLGGKGYPVQSKLLGKGNITNILAAATVAHYLGVPAQQIMNCIQRLQAAPHRLERRELPQLGVTLIDNAYNSNTTGFQQSLEVLSQFKGRSKVLVTPGIVELGQETGSIHKRLGKQVSVVCDYVFLVGKSERTEALAEGIEAAEKICWLNSIQELWSTLEKLDLKNPVVLLENDLPDNY